MRFTRIQAERFGPLRKFDSGERALSGLVSVLGPNEAGKSAFHELLCSVLYGFHPSTQDQNPFTPWRTGTIEVEAELRSNGESTLKVHRRLLKTPRASIVRGAEVEKLGNRPIPDLGPIDRKVYSEVYAITLAQLTGLREAAWETVQEQLVVGMGAQDLRSARAAMRGFRDAAKRLWQPSKRGKQRHRELRADLAELGRSRRQAEGRAAELRDQKKQIDKLRERLDELATEKTSRIERLAARRELLPLKRRLEKLDALEQSLGNREALAAAPRDPVEKKRELNDQLERSRQRIEEIQESRVQVRATSIPPAEPERRVLERADSVRALASNAPLVHERASRRAALEGAVSELEGGIREASVALLGTWPADRNEQRSPSEEAVDWGTIGRSFRTLEIAGLREHVVDAETEGRRREDLEERLADVGKRATRRPPIVSPFAILLVLLSAGVLLSGVWLSQPLVAGAGVTLLILAGGVLARSWSRQSAARQLREAGIEEQKRLRSRIADADGRERLALSSARELLIPLGLSVDHLDAPSMSLVNDIGELKDLFHQRHDRVVELSRLEDEEAVFNQEFDRLVPDLGLTLPEDRGLALLELGRMLQTLEERRVRAEEATAEEARLQAALEREQGEQAECDERRRAFEAAVLRAGGSLDDDGLLALAARIADLDAFRRAKEELEGEVGSLSALRARIREAQAEGEDWGDDPAGVAGEESALQALDIEGQEIREQIGRLQEREKTILEEDTVDLVDGQILHVRAELRHVERERDRYLVLAQLLEQAEARFRAEHQPDLLRRAEEHLDTITSGRYRTILVGEMGGAQGFFLDAPHLPELTPVAPPLSTGTREQVYLALRLAIIEHLDQDVEPLPLLLDEVLVNWDPDRRSRVMDLLSEVSAHRQVFCFTCHPHIADEVVDRGGMLLSLDSS